MTLLEKCRNLRAACLAPISFMRSCGSAWVTPTHQVWAKLPCSAGFIEGYRRVIPVVCIVGKHNAGKTTLLEKLIPCLQQRGRRVAVIKHAAHGFSLDREGSDSWRLAQTGADAVVLSGPGNAVTLCRLPDDASLPQVLGLLPVMGFDLVLVEGYKSSDYPKIEVHRTALGPDLLLAEEQLAAVVTDAMRHSRYLLAALTTRRGWRHSWTSAMGVQTRSEMRSESRLTVKRSQLMPSPAP